MTTCPERKSPRTTSFTRLVRSVLSIWEVSIFVCRHLPVRALIIMFGSFVFAILLVLWLLQTKPSTPPSTTIPTLFTDANGTTVAPSPERN